MDEGGNGSGELTANAVCRYVGPVGSEDFYAPANPYPPLPLWVIVIFLNPSVKVLQMAPGSV